MDFSVTHRLLAVTSEWTQMYLRTRYIHERGAERVIVEKERGKSTKVCLLACVQTMASTTTSYLRNALILLQFCFRFRILNPLEISLSVISTRLRLLFFSSLCSYLRFIYFPLFSSGMSLHHTIQNHLHQVLTLLVHCALIIIEIRCSQ